MSWGIPVWNHFRIDPALTSENHTVTRGCLHLAVELGSTECLAVADIRIAHWQYLAYHAI